MERTKVKRKVNPVHGRKMWREIWRARYVYLLILPVVIYMLLFHYWPMYWLKMSFYDYKIFKGFDGSEFLGLENFRKLFEMKDFWKMIRNVLVLNLYSLLFCFPAPVILAVMLNELRGAKFKKAVQTITYLPHFISMVAFVALITTFVSPSTGTMGSIMRAFGREPIYFLGDEKYFRAICVISGIWQGTGWGAVVYLSALTSIDSNLYEAAMVDGANRWQRLLHVTLPGIAETFIVLLLLSIGNFISVGFDQYFIFQNPVTLKRLEVLDLYVYRLGLINKSYSYSTAIGMIKSLISLVMIFGTNQLAKKIRGNSII